VPLGAGGFRGDPSGVRARPNGVVAVGSPRMIPGLFYVMFGIEAQGTLWCM
jgi:hypothetical protein